MSEHIPNLMFMALEHEAQANIDKAEATIEIYFNGSVGIGEHPQLLEEMGKQLDIIATNEDRLTTLKKYFSDYNEARGNI